MPFLKRVSLDRPRLDAAEVSFRHTYPGAAIWHFTDTSVHPIAYEETEHYELTRDYLNNRERYYCMLFTEEEGR
ncbi:hypothetical protein ACFFK0_24745 [Paenibacillus chartarius]|uniref:Uncharacterized protein n=1 Tax=Paenibacillus chartarius TaxID=747481 RepID=A0ABV6DSI2_9BACL